MQTYQESRRVFEFNRQLRTNEDLEQDLRIMYKSDAIFFDLLDHHRDQDNDTVMHAIEFSQRHGIVKSSRSKQAVAMPCCAVASIIQILRSKYAYVFNFLLRRVCISVR